MPSPTTSKYPVPRSWDEFEDIVADVFRIRWEDPNINRYGRTGQAQHGVDIVGRPRYLDRAFAGIQCKNVASLNATTVFQEADNARSFTPPLRAYIIATTAARDTAIQSSVWAAEADYPFELDVVFWDDICADIAGHQELLQKHFPGWAKATTTRVRAIEVLATASPTDFRFSDQPPQYMYTPDVDIRLLVDRSGPPELFYEPWLDCFMSHAHYVYKLHLHVRDSRIETFWFVNADGGRVVLPYTYPSLAGGLRISPLQYNIARIVNAQHRGANLDSALQRTGIVVDLGLRNWPAEDH